MERKKYNLIYDYYECHILFGHLEQGSLLPTIEQICDAFQVAPQTVRNALRKLESNGLISVSPGRRTIVVYKATPAEKLRYTQNYYLARKDAIAETYRISGLILMPLFYEGCMKLSEDDLLHIGLAAQNKNANIVTMTLICFNSMLKALDNRLAKELIYDLVSFFQFPYVPSFNEENEEGFRRHHELLLTSCQTSDRSGIYRAFSYFQGVTRNILLSFIDEAAKVLPVPEQIPFHWMTYRDRPQLCHSLAAAIIKKVIYGEYNEKDMLPSYDKMAKELSVSVSTARRTVGLLRDMGFLRSINGVGNQISFSAPDPLRMKRPAMQDNISAAIQSTEILLLTSDGIITHSLPLLSGRQTDELKIILNKKKRGLCGLDIALPIMEYIAAACPFPMAARVYSIFSEFLILSYPLLSSQPETGKDIFALLLKDMADALENQNTALFCRRLNEILKIVDFDLRKI